LDGLEFHIFWKNVSVGRSAGGSSAVGWAATTSGATSAVEGAVALLSSLSVFDGAVMKGSLSRRDPVIGFVRERRMAFKSFST
jgi:hypothetical protein